MSRIRRMMLWTVAACVLVLAAGAAQAATIAELEQQLRDEPASLTVKEALAEAYLTECELEKSLKLWREILVAAPGHERAKRVVDRLTLQALDLDSHLAVLDRLIEKGISEGTEELLDAAAERAATDSQKARIVYLRGALALRTNREAVARANFEAALKLYPDTAWAARAAIALAQAEARAGRGAEARRLLGEVITGTRIKEATVKEEARFQLALIESQGLTSRERVASLRALLPQLTVAEVKRRVYEELIRAYTQAQGQWTPEAVEAAEAIFKAGPPFEQAHQVLVQLAGVAKTNQDPATLDRLLVLLRDTPLKDPALSREAAFVRVETFLARAVAEDGPDEVERYVGAARAMLDELAAGREVYPERRRVERLRGRSYLVEAQKLIVLGERTTVLPVLVNAKDHYLARLVADPEEAPARLEKIGGLLEHVREWEMAAALYREMATEFPHRSEGRDALLKLASLYDRHLDAPMQALAVYAEYAARYPAELPYRQLGVGQRLQRLGYANLLDFQKRNRLNPDGVFGTATRAKLQQLEASFDMIARRDGGSGSDVLRGVFVHPTMFAIASRLEKAGRHHDAIVAYRLFLNLFPTKKQADDALIAVARLFRDNLLFEEALSAYTELREDFPKGDKTSLAYIEAAGCLENLGRWQQAQELYERYLKEYPQYNQAPLAKARLALLEEIGQYEEFIATNPASPKLAEAQYQIGVILYKQMKNLTKAAVEFYKVAQRYPKHVRAPEALFTAGTAQLHAENFPAARSLYAELVAGYPDSRLADDGQYWIGHTYEYSARAVGKLDEGRIVLKRRSLHERARLLGDLELRRRYHPGAEAGPEVPEEVWGGDTLGVLASGSKRDRVNADLFRAIRAYREVVEKFKMGDMAGDALLQVGTIYTKYLKDPEKGILAYQELLAHYPGSEEAIDALFEVGGYYLEKKEYDEAIKAYQQFTYNYPQNAKVEDAMLAIARCHAEQKVWDKALDAYQSYLNKFPDGTRAGFAKARVAWIRMYHF